MYLGIDRDKGLIYEGRSFDWGMRALIPPPNLFDMQIGETVEEAIKKLTENAGNEFRTPLFREDSFDPVRLSARLLHFLCGRLSQSME